MSRLDRLTWATLPEGYPRPAQRYSETSVAAAQSISDRTLGDLHRRVYAHLRDTGGNTDEAAMTALGMAPNTYRPRRRELELAGYVKDSGRTVRGNSGRTMVVWCVTDRGRP